MGLTEGETVEPETECPEGARYKKFCVTDVYSFAKIIYGERCSEYSFENDRTLNTNQRVLTGSEFTDEKKCSYTCRELYPILCKSRDVVEFCANPSAVPGKFRKFICQSAFLRSLISWNKSVQ